MKIYLSGPIVDCSEPEKHVFRDMIKIVLPECQFVDPTARGLDSFAVKEIVEGDKEDLISCDLVLVDWWKISVGTSMEILLAWENDIPVIVKVPPSSPPVTNPWIIYHATKIFCHVSDVVEYIKECHDRT